jgi:hypothetical protein
MVPPTSTWTRWFCKGVTAYRGSDLYVELEGPNYDTLKLRYFTPAEVRYRVGCYYELAVRWADDQETTGFEDEAEDVTDPADG